MAFSQKVVRTDHEYNIMEPQSLRKGKQCLYPLVKCAEIYMLGDVFMLGDYL